MLALSIAAQPSKIANTPEPVNALWNDDAGFGVWVYPGSGTCPEIRTRQTTFVVFGPKFQPRLPNAQSASASEMAVCMRMNGTTRDMTRCKSGSVQMTYNAATNEYDGYIDLTLSDGSIVRQTIRAQYCTKS